MDFEGPASRLGIDKEDFLELVDLFITTTQKDLGQIRRGMEDNAPSEAAAAAHSIKGAAGNLGFEDMARVAQKMEFRGKEGSLEGVDVWIAEMEVFLNRLRDSLADETV